MVAWGRDGDRGGRKEECEQEKTPEGDAFVHYLDPGDGFMGLGICQKLSDCALSNWASYYYIYQLYRICVSMKDKALS